MTGLFLPVHQLIQGKPGTVAFIEVIVVTLIAMAWGTGPAIVASAAGVVAWSFFFLPPYYAVKISSLRLEDGALMVSFLITSIAVVQLSALARSRAQEAEASRRRLELLYTELQREMDERKRTEDQLLQSQKMESIGRLAGGMAHDLNNILTAVFGYADGARGQLQAADPVVNDIEQIKRAAERGARLTGQLLLFARKGVVEPKVLDLNRLTRDLSGLLRRLIGEDVEFVEHFAPDPWAVRADVGQIEQVLINLAVNARDAMPDGGRLTIETSNALVGEAESRALGLPPGAYVRVTIADTGVGMSAETKAHLFEPFFTTKERGKGTGLGLATCYGIVKQCGGQILCRSEPGKGTTFSIYFPRFVGQPEDEPVRAASTAVLGGSETVLLVEDEAAVRRLAVRALREQGYRVIEAADGVEALQLAGNHPERIDLLVTDVIMPRMGGRALAERLRAGRPDLSVLYTSGYADDGGPQLELDRSAKFLQKPFSVSTLAQRVREALQRS